MTSLQSFDVHLDLPHAEATARVIDALKKEGFGALTRIDLHHVLKEKLDVEIEPHTILGACNPKLAHRALSAAPEVGLLLPCNVTIQKTKDGSLVRIINPTGMMQDMVDNPAIAAVATEASEGLRRAADSLAGKT